MSARLRHLFRRVGRRRDEGGMALVMVLVAVIVIGVMFSAILGYQGAALTAQGALSNQRDDNLASDAAIDSAIMYMQKDTTFGNYSNVTYKCHTTSAVSTFTYVDPTVGDVVLWCKMTSTTSGANATRDVELTARIDGVIISTADVTVYDPPSGSSPSKVSITNWDRLVTS